ncbi:MAG: HDIG domain-containing protein [Planctomycetota bacterium]|nr:MAG: HDIG domain-containing protein [Planctomycetota bacterium]
MFDRAKAWDILTTYTKNPALIRHALCVEAAMRHYARRFGEDPDYWGLVGLLHDFDYERYPQAPEHTEEGGKILLEAGADPEFVDAIKSHVPWNAERYPRDTPLRKTLFAVDELCGFIYAVALVRPERIVGLKPKSVVKKLKQKAFAAAVSREDIREGADLLGLELSEHIACCIEALTDVAGEVGLLPDSSAETAEGV